jgi:heme A synthase
MSPKHQRFLYYSWAVLAYTVLVIMWGAYVRATGSGAGCGAHWPTCNGQIIPRPEQIETWIELSHRITSAMLGFFSIGQVVWAFRLYPAAHRVRKAAVAALGLTIFEGMLGAGLVIFELVAGDTSTARAIVVGFHLINTMLLVGAFTLVVWWAAGGAPLQLGGKNTTLRNLLGIGLLAMLVLSAFGAITALGDTLFPPESLAEGLAQKFDPEAHFAVRLRIWHPVLAILTSAYLLAILFNVDGLRDTAQKKWWATAVAAIIILQVIGGFINVLLLAPVWMQLFHLMASNALWIAILMWSFASLSVQTDE